ncbi:MAG: aminotransferase class IV, partial [Planctomycetes bacterium]|nr:aminotransferase class IV [Planctomycetota bacterium]
FTFRPLDHFTRFLNSGKLLSYELDYTPESLTDILQELLRTEGWQENVYIRPLIYAADNIIGVKLHDLNPQITIFSLPFGSYVPNEEGTRVTFSSWNRIDDNSIPARGKITGAYANSALIKTDAIRAGYDEALGGGLERFPGAGLFAADVSVVVDRLADRDALNVFADAIGP